MVYWFMRMRQGSEGKDFTSELWEQNLIGVFFGTWTIQDVLNDSGGIDESKVTYEHLKRFPPKGEPTFKKEWFDSSYRFLRSMSANHRVVVEFGGSLHIATVTDEFYPDPDPLIRDHEEQFKCRRIYDKRNFPLERLPSSYRLISSTGRGTVQRIRAYEPLVKLLDQYKTPEEVTETCSKMSSEQLLEVLSPKQWEAICTEYLRVTEGVRPLLLAVGSTLKDIDIYGVNRDGSRVLAQCKNDPKPWKSQIIDDWAHSLAKSSKDILYFFARGGVEGYIDEDKCKIVDDKEILKWLQSEDDYERYLKTF